MNKIYRFEVTGGFDVNKKFKEKLSCTGDVCALKLPDGRTVRPMLALEVESKDGNSFEYITDEIDMSALGFEGLDYDNVGFEREGE